jgi:predicted GTPase
VGLDEDSGAHTRCALSLQIFKISSCSSFRVHQGSDAIDGVKHLRDMNTATCCMFRMLKLWTKAHTSPIFNPSVTRSQLHTMQNN